LRQGRLLRRAEARAGWDLYETSECILVFVFCYVRSLLLYKYEWRRCARCRCFCWIRGFWDCSSVPCQITGFDLYCRHSQSSKTCRQLWHYSRKHTLLYRSHVISRRRKLRRKRHLRAATQLFPLARPPPLHTPQCSDSFRRERASSGAMRRACGLSTIAAAGPLPASPAPSSTPIPRRHIQQVDSNHPQTLRCHSNRRRSCWLRSLYRRSPFRRAHRPRHALNDQSRRLLMQPFVRRHRQRHHAARD
jgi:hypothetical protein